MRCQGPEHRLAGRRLPSGGPFQTARGTARQRAAMSQQGDAMVSKSADVKNTKRYDGLRDKGMSKERAAKIANSPDASERGDKASGKGGSAKQGGTMAQHKAAGQRAVEPRRSDREHIVTSCTRDGRAVILGCGRPTATPAPACVAVVGGLRCFYVTTFSTERALGSPSRTSHAGGSFCLFRSACGSPVGCGSSAGSIGSASSGSLVLTADGYPRAVDGYPRAPPLITGAT